MQLKLLRLIIMVSKNIMYGLLIQVFLYTILLADDLKAQVKTIKDIQIQMESGNYDLRNVFLEIEKRTELKFVYPDRILESQELIRITSKKQSVYDLLSNISKVAKLQFKQVNEVIYVGDAADNIPSTPDVSIVIQTRNVTGKVTSLDDDEGLPGVNVLEKGTNNGTVTDVQGNYSLSVSEGAVLVFSSVGYTTEEVGIGNQSVINLKMNQDVQQLSEIVVVGYGVQRKSDITGSVASLSRERLDMVPNQNIAQAIQGSIPGLMVQTITAGAEPKELLMVRGRNSILADNSPLIVLDGVQYSGSLSGINPNDVESIEILKDASAAAIYGSRGANGVILVTTKAGKKGRTIISYDTYYSIQSHINMPDVMNGEEFYNFKQTREPGMITQTEQEVYDAKAWVDWPDLGLRNGAGNEHTLSVSGGTKENIDVNYFISGSLLDVKGLAVNDDFRRYTGRINIDTKIADWLTIGTRTSFSSDDRSGNHAIIRGNSGVYAGNPLTKAYDAEGNLSIYIWPEFTIRSNPLEPLNYINSDKTRQASTNNFAIIDIPFIPGLSNRINTGIRYRVDEANTYMARDTKTGFEERGSADIRNSRYNDIILENILTYNKIFGKHNLFATGVLGYENNNYSTDFLNARGFPNDILTWHAVRQAEFIVPGTDYLESTLHSQMLRLNYAYDSRYLLTLTARRDGYSGFGAENKYGTFPSVALGWNIAQEKFFPWEVINTLKLRASLGSNGNQAVGAYETIARMREENMVSLEESLPGFVPNTLAEENLGWESSRTLNFGFDLSMYNGRFNADLNLYQTNTKDLLLERTISLVHGITSITQNIGATKNKGLELDIVSYNISSSKFKWSTRGNISFNKNEIIDLYGDGNDDVANAWFIGKPVLVNFDYVWEGTWQLDEADKATFWGTEPGYVKIKDVNNDDKLTDVDRQIIGQKDPKMMWGMTNSFSYRNFSLSIFIHGIQGATLLNSMMRDNVFDAVHHNTTKKNWWTPENPTNEWIINRPRAERMAGLQAGWYEDASFIRLKDVSLSYELPGNLTQSLRLERLRLYVTGRNQYTITKWKGIDPETASGFEGDIPLQKEIVFGVNISF